MNESLKAALRAYARTILQDGWDAGEQVIKQHELAFKDFRRWAYALGILLRAREILDEKT